MVVLLYLRLSPSRIHALASKITLGASAIWMVFSETLISIRCNPLDSWTQSPEACALSIVSLALAFSSESYADFISDRRQDGT